MKLTPDILKELAEMVMSPAMVEERNENKKRYLMFHGKTKPVIEAAIKKEFKKQETINELMARLVPLNVMQKIVNKLAGVYKEAPQRKVSSGDEEEQEMLEKLEDALDINMRMKEANRYFKMNKRALIEPYLDDMGVPSLRVLPAHTYEPFSYKTKKKSVPNVICKIDEDAERLIWWSDESHLVTNKKGEPIQGALKDNSEGENPYGILQFEYINESSNSVYPIQDDDLLAVSIAIPVLLTDLLFGMKYQCWAIIWTVGKFGDIPFNPNSVISAEYDADGNEPKLNTVKPDIDSDKMLNVVMALVSLLLTTKNLQAGSISDQVTAQNAASGIAKVLDSAESVEDKKDQQAYFLKAERGIFQKLKIMMAYWKETRQLSTEMDMELPEDFTISTVYQEPGSTMTEQEQVATSKAKIDAKLSTIKRELKNLYPDMKEEEIEKLYNEILDETAKIAGMSKAVMTGAKDGVESEVKG